MVMGDDDVGSGRNIAIEKLIKGDPERYVIVPASADLEEGETFKSEQGKVVRIIVQNYLRKGLCVVDTSPDIRDQTAKKSKKVLPVVDCKKKDNGLKFKEVVPEEPVSEIGYIDILSKHFGEIIIRRLTSRVEAVIYTVIEIKFLPIVFIGKSLEQCFQKLVRFMIVDIFDLIKIFEEKELRSGIKNVVGKLAGDNG